MEKELLEDSGKSVNDFRSEIYKKFNIEGEQRTPVIENYAPEPKNPFLVEKESSQSQIDGSPKLSEMKEEFIGERLLSGFSPKSTREIESTIDDFVEIIGDIPISKATPNNARYFKKIISQLPKYRSQSPRYRGLTIKQILNLDDLE